MGSHAIERSVALPVAPAAHPVESTETGALCKRYVNAMGAFGTAPGEMDTLVLGCTHYIFVAHELRTLVGPDVQFIETGEPVARQTKRLLDAAGFVANSRLRWRQPLRGWYGRYSFRTPADHRPSGHDGSGCPALAKPASGTLPVPYQCAENIDKSGPSA